ncbi:hypothetical protein N7508_010467 [Penicillium antarcticum]|uniref:uncharacterized protein n=1 Tax=Penicillium antarcticum TaxID=416450 RepID=UPI0023820E5B|nr:uncharacterized protein N7508_010467 [Penicillium antarcticum]KAJ5295646.1 hypothetical protein N7508_010467 [Penicillium antarcticum]
MDSFHGIGTNSETFKQQTAAIRYELGDGHTYDFVDGTLPWEMDKDIKEFMLSDENTFTYYTPTRPETCFSAFNNLEHYLEAEGPYDGVMGFSLGAAFVMSWMINRIQKQKGNKFAQLPFKVGIFFSNGGPLLDCNDSSGQSVLPFDPIAIDGILDIPTAHIWGRCDPEKGNAEFAIRACNQDTRSVFVHERGHEVPKSAENVISAAKVINRAIARAQGFN